MKAVSRSGEVKVLKSSAAVVRNSSVELSVHVFTEGWPDELVAVVWDAGLEVLGFAFVCAAVDELVMEVV